MKAYILSFIPIFIAVNALGVLPLFISLTEGVNKKARHNVVQKSLVTATGIAIVFMLIGQFIMLILGITVADFKIAGGILLLILSVNLLLPGEQRRGKPTADVGVFPLGTPLITGPAVLTTLLVLLGTHGLITTLISFILNMFIVWIIFYYADNVMRILGKGGARAFSKVADIFLTAFAVMMIRNGILEIIARFR